MSELQMHKIDPNIAANSLWLLNYKHNQQRKRSFQDYFLSARPSAKTCKNCKYYKSELKCDTCNYHLCNFA